MGFIKLRVLLKRIKAIRFMMADKSVAWWKKALIVFGILYLFLPIDLIPVSYTHLTLPTTRRV